MEKYSHVIKSAGGILGGILGFCFGEFTVGLKALVALMFLDFISGVLAAGARGEISSKVGFIGIAKKVFILTLAAVGHLIDGITVLNGLCMNVVVFFYIANEAMSIIENAGRIGLPIPDKLLDAISQLNGKEGGNV